MYRAHTSPAPVTASHMNINLSDTQNNPVRKCQGLNVTCRSHMETSIAIARLLRSGVFKSHEGSAPVNGLKLLAWESVHYHRSRILVKECGWSILVAPTCLFSLACSLLPSLSPSLPLHFLLQDNTARRPSQIQPLNLETSSLQNYKEINSCSYSHSVLLCHSGVGEYYYYPLYRC